MRKIVPHLWFDDSAEEAVHFYTSIFKNASVINTSRYGEAGSKVSGRKASSVMLLNFELAGQRMMALNGGPHFQFTPAISFFVDCETEEELDLLWDKLLEGGQALMELGQYSFSDKYGWLMDQFGVTWQLSLSYQSQRVSPFFMFVGEQYGKAEEAMHFYTTLFDHSKVDHIEPGQDETVRQARFTLDGQSFMAIDSNGPHRFTFNEAFSLLVNCESQDELDSLWLQLCDGGEPGQCGWLKDRYGVSWQIVPTALGKLMETGDARQSERVVSALLKMKKIDIEALKSAHEGGGQL